MVRHIRFHGRGGEGVKLASRIVSRAAFLNGRTVQDSPLYGAERRGAPVVAFVRVADGPIYERGYIDDPDIVVVMDDSLFEQPEAAVLDGLTTGALLIANSGGGPDLLKTRYAIPGQVITLDISSIALEHIGHHFLSAPIAGFTSKVAAVAPWDIVAEAVRSELAAADVTPDMIERNLLATRYAFDRATAVPVCVQRSAAAAAAGPPFIVPRLPARIAAPSITAEANSLLRSMEGWRVYRPEIHLERCTRCFMCFALCPEGAIHLDGENYPQVDYDHCKGCLVCVAECPPRAISEVRERATA
jgi:pyruvate ferredoxin oxidoreductase gamma subunit